MSPNNNNKQSQLVAPTILRGATKTFESQFESLLAIPASEVIRVYLPVRKATLMGLASAERIKEYAQEISRLHESEIDEVEELRSCCLTLWHADVVATEPEADQMKVVADEGYEVRNLLVSSARDLSQRDLLPKARVDAVSMIRSYVDVSADLYTLSELFEAAWDDVEGKTPVTKEEVAKARSLSERIGSHAIVRQANLPDGDGVDPMDIRNRAFTKFVKQHKRVRKAVAFIIEDDETLNEVIPPLTQSYLHGSRRREGSRIREVAEASATELAPPGGEIAESPGGALSPTGGPAVATPAPTAATADETVDAPELAPSAGIPEPVTC